MLLYVSLRRVFASDVQFSFNFLNYLNTSVQVEVTNVKNVIVTSSYDVHKLLNKANKNRTVAATKCNQRSSRSHSVYRLRIDGKNKNG